MLNVFIMNGNEGCKQAWVNGFSGKISENPFGLFRKFVGNAPQVVIPAKRESRSLLLKGLTFAFCEEE